MSHGSNKSKALEDAHFDVTPLVDLVFMMNIYFMIVWIMISLAEVDLPAAKHVVASDKDNMVVFALVDKGTGPIVFLGEAESSPPITSPAEIELRVRRAVEEGAARGAELVLIRAEKKVKLRDLARVSSVVNSVPKMKIRLAVAEKE